MNTPLLPQKKDMRKFVNHPIFFSIFLLLLCILSFGLLIPSLGFYWDDWPMAWFAHTTGPLGFFDVFEGDRPFLAGIYLITTTLLDTVPYQWQILGLLARWAASLVVWWTIRKLWPQNSQRAVWIAALFAVFPGFKQQPISIVYSNGFFLLLFYIASYGLNIMAIRNRKKYFVYTILALLSYSLCTFSTEYYLGLDLFRGVIIFLVISESVTGFRNRVVKTLKHWLPYICLLLIFLVWRVLIFKFPTYRPELLSQISPSPLKTLIDLVSRIFTDGFKMGWLAWIEPFEFPDLTRFNALSTIGFWLLVIFTFFGSFLFFKIFSKGGNEKKSSVANTDFASDSKTVVLAGLSGLLCAGWPFWITNLPIGLQFPYDRFGLAFMLVSSIFLVGLIEYLIRTPLQKIILFSLILSMAVGSNFNISNQFRRDWSTLKDMLWQLSWRVPGLKPGTLLLTYGLPLNYFSDNSLTAPINWMYAPDNKSLEIPYYLAFTDVRLGESIPSFDAGQDVAQPYRNANFTGSTSQALVFSFSPPACLWVIDPERDDTLPIFPSELSAASPISNLSQIIPVQSPSASPPEKIFGDEPGHNWCYYFEKAELARQEKDWGAIKKLGDEAFNLNLVPGQAQELLVFVEGYIQTGNWMRAIDLSNLAYDKSKDVEVALCKLLHQYKDELPPSEDVIPQLQTSLAVLGCPLD